jgi:hypothetical protein
MKGRVLPTRAKDLSGIGLSPGHLDTLPSCSYALKNKKQKDGGAAFQKKGINSPLEIRTGRLFLF